MAIPKYKHLIKPLNIGAMHWEETKKALGPSAALVIGPGNASREVRLNGPDHLQGLNLNFSWGVHTELGDWHAGLDPHVHPYPECLLFMGLDTANINYLGAEITCCLGSEQETYAFNEPTVIVIPGGFPHGPITTKRMYSPKGFGFLAVELNPVTEITWLGEGVSSLSAEQRSAVPKGLTFAAAEKILRNKPIPATGKYDHLVKSLRSGLRIERGEIRPEQLAQHGEKSQKPGQKLGPGNADHLAWMCGKDLESLDVNISWGFHSQPGIWQRGVGSHVHPVGEVMVYAGTGTDSVDYLGAEIEVDMGEEHERYLIDKPTVVVCPAGIPHNPQVTRWVDKPYAFFAISLSGEQESKSFD
jgi:hypothetical protein